MKKIYMLLFTIVLFCSATFAQVTLTATGGTLTGSFTTLKGAFDAINAGTHTGTIVISINGSTTETTTPCILNSTGAGAASYTSLLIKPTVTATISGTTVLGRGLIELNGADNVTIDGAISGSTRDLTISNTAAAGITFTSVIRIATLATTVTSADGNTVKNCILNGSASGRNASGNTSTTGSENTTFGVYCGGAAGSAISNVTSITAPSGTTINNLTIDNNTVNSCARGIVFNGAAATVASGNLTITNNIIGASGTAAPATPPYTSPATTVYTKGIWVAGTSAVTISTNTIQNIISYVSTTGAAIELASANLVSTITRNTISTVANNGTANIVKAILVTASTFTYTISKNTITNVQTLAASSGTDAIEATTAATNPIVEQNVISTVYNRSTSTFGAYGMNFTSGTGIQIRNNFISDINMDMTSGSAFSTQFSVYGIRITGGTNHKIYHNSINLSGALLGTAASNILTSCLTITGTGVTGVDVRNNIFSNIMTGGTTNIAHVALSLPSGAGSTMALTINNNAYYCGADAARQGTAQAGTTAGTGFYPVTAFNAAATTPATNLRAYTSTLGTATNDNASYASSNGAPYISTSNSHLNLASSELVNAEQKGDPVVGVAVDIDGDTRPNSGTTNPDMGADEVIVTGCTGQPATGAISPASVSRCVGQTYTMTATGATIGSGISYQWQISATPGGPYANVTGGTGATTTSYTTAALATGTYYYILQTTCANSGQTNISNELVLTVNALPVVNVTPTTANFCNPGGTPVSLTASGASTYAWSPATGLSAATGASVTASPVTSTLYTVTGTDGNNCSATATTNISVIPSPSITALTATPSTVCTGANSQLAVTVNSTLPTYIFSFASGTALETITSPTTVATVTAGNTDDGSNLVTPTPAFSFSFNGTTYTDFSAETNGWLKMGATASSTYPSTLTDLAVNGIFAFGRDGNMNTTNGGNLIHGPAAGGKYVFQFTKHAGASNGVESAAIYSTMQIVLWGSTSATPGKIDIIYGANLGTPATNGVIGIAASTGVYLNAVTGNSTATTTTSSYPATGTRYTFTPQSFTYLWSPASFLSDPAIANPVATAVTANTTYTVVVTSNGCATTSSPLPVTIATYNSSVTTQPSTAAVTGGALSAQVLALDVPQACTPENITQLNFTNASSLPADVTNATVYYTTTNTFATTNLFGSFANPGASFSVTGTQVLSTTTHNYFWLVYDVACNATNANTIDAGVTSFVIGGNSYSAATANPAGTRTITGLATLLTTNQPSIATVTNGGVDQQIVRVLVPATNCGILSAITFNTNGSTNAAVDLAAAKVYYTTTTTFATTTQFGSFTGPNGSFTINGTQALSTTTNNYFWLVYDISCGAVAADIIDAEVNSLTIAGIGYTPATINPAGTRTISALYAPTRTDPNGTTAVQLGTANAQFAYAVIGGSALCPGTVSTVNFAVTNPNPTDVVNAKCYYTTTSTFSNAMQFGSSIPNPSAGPMSFNGSQLLAAGNNYFWVVYDISCVGTVGASLNADINSLVVNAATIPVTGTATGANALAAIAAYTTVADGEWNNTGSWACGNIPPTNATAVIIGNNITVSNAGNIAGSVIINAGASLSVNAGGVLTTGTSGGGNTTFTSNGTLNVTGGTLAVNGNVILASGSTFNQSSGSIVVDGNANGVTGSSVAAGTVLFLQQTALGSVTGGSITIVDPPATGTARSFTMNLTSGNIVFGAGHTLNLGDGVSADASAGTVGFAVDTYAGSLGTHSLTGNVVVNGGSGTNRFGSVTTSTANGTFIGGNLTINAGSEMRQATASTVLLLSRDLINNGTFTSAGIVGLASLNLSSFVASVNPQTIGGTGVYRNLAASPTANLTNLQIINSNATGVTFATPISISGTLTMSSGIINTSSTNLLTLGYNTTNVGTLSYTAGQIVGPFKRWITAATGSRQFPMGTPLFLKNANINFTTAPTAGSLTARWVSLPPAAPAPSLIEGSLTVDAVAKQGSWFIDAADGLTGGVYTATFTANGSTDVTDYTKTVLVKRPTAGGIWVLNGTHVTTTGSNTAPVLSRTAMSGFSEFAIGGQNINVVPVSIEYFKGSKLATSNYLNWRVSCTSAPSVQIVLERSADGRNFKAIQDQHATAVQCQQEFNYTDASPLLGMNYYRLKIVTPDGAFRYSVIVALLSKDKGFEFVNIAPNPVKSTATLTLTTVKGAKMDIAVSDMNGKVVMKQTVTVMGGNNVINLNFATLGAGTYQITGVTPEGETKTIRFVKL